MNRKQLDQLLASVSLIVGAVLLMASGGLFYANSFVHTQVNDQLASEKIVFPAADSKSLAALPAADKAEVSKYAGQTVLTGVQAKVFADNYIAVHVKTIGGGKTYSELSSQAQLAPNDTKLAGQVATVFKGETLRGLLLNAYAFDTMATVALYAAYGTLAAGILLLILAAVGFVHAGNIKSTKAKSSKR